MRHVSTLAVAWVLVWPVTAQAELPIWLGPATKVCQGQAFRNAENVVQFGTRPCPVAACTSDGQKNCVTNDSFKSGSASALDAAAISSEVTLGGVTGTFSAAPAACSVDAEEGCLASGNYVAVKIGELAANNIRAGVVISGVTGTYPSASNLLSGADANVSDLTGDNLVTSLRSAASFEWFSASGERILGAGDADLASASNLRNGTAIAGVTGNFTGSVSAAESWNIKSGLTVGGRSGDLNLDCRNGLNLAVYDTGGHARDVTVNSGTDTITSASHGFTNTQLVRVTASSVPTGIAAVTDYYVVGATTNTFQVSLTSGGAAIDLTSNGSDVRFFPAANAVRDYWETIDDYNNGGAAIAAIPDQNSAGDTWATKNLCTGVDTQGSSADDANVWADVSVNSTSTNTAEACAGSSHCMFKDKINGLTWGKAYTTTTWASALKGCNDLDYGGHQDWRLPTQKETMDAYIHGIRSAGMTNWITTTNMTGNFWTATSYSAVAAQAWQVTFHDGEFSTVIKSATLRYACVR